MFSIFHGLFSLFAIFKNNFDKQTQDDANKLFAKQHNDLTYYSSKGSRLVNNNRLVTTTYDWNTGHKVIKDLYNGKIYYDLTLESIRKQRKENKEKAIKKNDDVYMCTNNRGKAKGIKNVSTIYYDVDTDEPVAEIYINNILFYISYETGLITRVHKAYKNSIGQQLNFYKNYICPLKPDEIMEIFNERQKELQRNSLFNKDEEWMNLVYYLKPDSNHNYMTKKYYIDVIGRISEITFNDDLINQINKGLPPLTKIEKKG